MILQPESRQVQPSVIRHMTTAKKIPLSVAIITLNEEDRLPACLESVEPADDIVVVDSGSVDHTVDIASKYGARVFTEPWRGFGLQKRFAIDKCLHEWVLLLDADERIPPGTMDEIGAIVGGTTKYQAYSLARKNFFGGRWIRHGGWWPDRTVRLFRKDAACMPAKVLHEALEVDGEVGEMKNPMIHYTDRNLQQVIEKINRYSTVGAEELFQKGQNASLAKAVLRGGWAFFYNYFFRLGFLDRSEGFIIAVCDAVNKFYKYAKLREMHRRTTE